MQHRDIIVIRKVISEIDIGTAMLQDISVEQFLADEKLKRAVAMTVINIGELIKNVTDETRSVNPQIQWKAAAGMRDVAAHKYQTLRMEDVYNTAKADFPILKQQLSDVLESEDPTTA